MTYKLEFRLRPLDGPELSVTRPSLELALEKAHLAVAKQASSERYHDEQVLTDSIAIAWESPSQIVGQLHRTAQ